MKQRLRLTSFLVLYRTAWWEVAIRQVAGTRRALRIGSLVRFHADVAQMRRFEMRGVDSSPGLSRHDPEGGRNPPHRIGSVVSRDMPQGCRTSGGRVTRPDALSCTLRHAAVEDGYDVFRFLRPCACRPHHRYRNRSFQCAYCPRYF